MITPRTTRLVRVLGLQSIPAFVADTSCGDPVAARSTAVIVPTRNAAGELKRTIENRRLAGAATAVVFPDLLTREEFYDRLHQSLPDPRPRLSEFEREVLFRRASRTAGRGGAPPPFRLRARLVVEILAFYDELRRRGRTVADFDRLLSGSLESSAAIDRGAERMLRQTRFLAAAFAEFEALIAGSGALDEHGLRTLLIGADAPCVYRRVVVTVPDHSADSRGLWPADYDLLTRIPGLEHLDVVVTENVLASGFHQRIHDALPGIEEHRADGVAKPPVLLVPPATRDGEAPRWFTCRDREEELAHFVRAVRQHSDASALERIVVVFQRPLPYLYLARQVFQAGGLPYQTRDALPLAAEPFAAAVDLIFSFVSSEGARGSLVELMASPYWAFSTPDGGQISAEDVRAADRELRQLKYFGGWERLALLAQASGSPRHKESAPGPRAAAVIAAAHQAALELRPVWMAHTSSGQIGALLAFIRAHERLPDTQGRTSERDLRARAAILAALQELRQAFARHDDERLEFVELVGSVRRWIEGQTFSPQTGSGGVRLLDASAAAYADADEVRLVGLVESDWPERSARSIFYPTSLLSQLGWPPDSDRLAAARARFRDLVALPVTRLSVSTFTLEDDAIVAPSPFLEELDSSGLPLQIVPTPPPARVFLHEALWDRALGCLPAPLMEWATLRSSRTTAAEPMFHGHTGVREAGEYAVSHVERYLECPFKYFAGDVLRLEEEREDESGLTPQERGQFLHAVFEQFFTDWHAAGGRAITAANFDEALAMFEHVAEEKLATLGEADRALERNYLLGSAAAAGLAARAFAFEVEQGSEVLERLLEHTLRGEFVFQGSRGARPVRLRAKADRIDLLADGTLRLIDYKLSRAPKPSRAIQLPVYAACAQQSLEGHRGRSWKLSSAGYVAFREKNAFVPLGSSSSLEEALSGGQERFLSAIEGIEAGAFPPRPDEPFLCSRCGYALVCRKDYVGDE